MAEAAGESGRGVTPVEPAGKSGGSGGSGGPGGPHRRRSRGPLHAARWSAFAVGLVVIVLVAVLATRAPATTTEAYSPLVGRLAPGFTAPTFAGSPLRLSSFRGKWVLLNFFAPWCEQCREEEPSLEAFLYTRPGGARTAVVGVLYGDTLADGVSFQRQQGASWTSVVDRHGLIASTYGVGGLPRSYLIAPDGSVAAALVGAVTVAGLESIIRVEQQRGS
jgi:cytochrome c biogenesis protein CcmG/thiol:disulfide interchange protein DsbE